MKLSRNSIIDTGDADVSYENDETEDEEGDPQDGDDRNILEGLQKQTTITNRRKEIEENAFKNFVARLRQTEVSTRHSQVYANFGMPISWKKLF